MDHERILEEHHEIYRALICRNAQLAEKLMYDHLTVFPTSCNLCIIFLCKLLLKEAPLSILYEGPSFNHGWNPL